MMIKIFKIVVAFSLALVISIGGYFIWVWMSVHSILVNQSIIELGGDSTISVRIETIAPNPVSLSLLNDEVETSINWILGNVQFTGVFGCKKGEVTEKGISRIPQLVQVMQLSIEDSTVERKAMERLFERYPCKRVVLESVKELEDIIEPMSRQKKTLLLNLAKITLTDSVMAEISQCSSLLAISFSEVKAPAMVLQKLGSLREMESLSIHRTSIAVEDWQSVGSFQKLESLLLQNPAIPASAADAFSKLNRLQIVRLQGGSIARKVLSSMLSGRPPIQHFDIARCWVFSSSDDESLPIMSELSKVTSLASLRLNRSQFCDEDWKFLAQCAALKWLSLRGVGVTESHAKILMGLPSLASLSLSDATLEDGALHFLCQNGSPQALALANTMLPESAYKDLSKATSIKTLFIHDGQLTDEELENLRKIMNIELQYDDLSW